MKKADHISCISHKPPYSVNDLWVFALRDLGRASIAQLAEGLASELTEDKNGTNDAAKEG